MSGTKVHRYSSSSYQSLVVTTSESPFMFNFVFMSIINTRKRKRRGGLYSHAKPAGPCVTYRVDEVPPVAPPLPSVEVRHMPYVEYLKTPHWLSLRDRMYKEYKYMCFACSSDKSLHVHHMTYEHLGDERAYELVVLCNTCHKELHRGADKYSHLYIASVFFIRQKRKRFVLEEQLQLWLSANGDLRSLSYPVELRKQKKRLFPKKEQKNWHRKQRIKKNHLRDRPCLVGVL